MIAIYTKYIPATNTKGSRIMAYDIGGSDRKPRKLYIPYPHELSGEMVYFKAAELWVAKFLEYAPSTKDMRYGDAPNGYVFCFADSIVGK